jgi:hypothetical protein
MLIGTIPREVCYFFWGARVQAMQRIRNLTPIVAAAVGLLALAPNASAEDVLKVALAQRGAWDSAAPELGQQDGIFKKHGIVLDLLYAKQDGETESSVISGSADRETWSGCIRTLLHSNVTPSSLVYRKVSPGACAMNSLRRACYRRIRSWV